MVMNQPKAYSTLLRFSPGRVLVFAMDRVSEHGEARTLADLP